MSERDVVSSGDIDFRSNPNCSFSQVERVSIVKKSKVFRTRPYQHADQ